MLNRKYVIAALLALAIASPIVASGAGFDNIYVIGDSLSDQGNLFYATEFLTGSGIPADDHYWEGRFADGEIWAGVLADRMDITLEPSIFNFEEGTIDYECVDDGSDCGTNFAHGGARTDYNRVEDDSTKPHPVPYLGQGGVLPEDEFPWTIDTQVAAFATRGITGPDALYVVFSGANDLSDLISMVAACQTVSPLFCQDRGLPGKAIPVVLTGINNAIDTFAAAGARDILVPNMPNLGVIPAIIPFGQGFIDLATTLTAQYNQALDAMLELAQAKWEGQVNIIRFDTFSLITEVVTDPEAFGFSNAAEPCYTGFVEPDLDGTETECDAPDSYVFWDIEHPTAAFHAFLADRVMAAIVIDILDDLGQQVSGLDAKKGVKASLNAKLDGAMRALTDENTNNDGAAVRKLLKFIKMVEIRQGKHISDDTAVSLIERAEQVLALLDAI